MKIGPIATHRLLDHILERPALVSAIRHLPNWAMAKMIDHLGLEDAGELLGLAATEQIVSYLDQDLWGADGPGRDEVFDPDRFTVWLEVLLESGPNFAAQTMAHWPEDLVMLALFKHLLVIDMDSWALALDDQPEQLFEVDKALASCLSQEFDQYMLISRRYDGWDALVDVLCALDETDHQHFQRLMDRICTLSADTIEDHGGLFQTLSAEEMLEEDAAGDREDRRAELGYVAPATARAFIALIRQTPLADMVGQSEPDPVSQAYFRNYAGTQKDHQGPGPNHVPPDSGDGRALLNLLRQMEDSPPPGHKALALAAEVDEQGEPILFRRAMSRLSQSGTSEHQGLMSQLTYLANVLVAGAQKDGRSYRRAEAAEEVVRLCDKGLRYLLEQEQGRLGQGEQGAQGTILGQGPIKLFRIGFRLLDL